MRTSRRAAIKAGILKSALNAWNPRMTTRVFHIPSGCLDRCIWGLFIRPEPKYEGNVPILLREGPEELLSERAEVLAYNTFRVLAQPNKKNPWMA